MCKIMKFLMQQCLKFHKLKYFISRGNELGTRYQYETLHVQRLVQYVQPTSLLHYIA